MPQYTISPQAISDLEEIIDYFKERNVEAGDRLLNEFSKKCRYLTQFPLIGRNYFQIRSYLRGVPMQNYIIFYRVIDDGLEIMRVIRGDRNLEAMFEQNS